MLPLAKELGVAVLTNRNFNDGALFRQVEGKSLPGWAAEAGITSWAQMFLKYIIAHPAITCVIPTTGKSEHILDNLQTRHGHLPDSKQRARIIKTAAAL